MGAVVAARLGHGEHKVMVLHGWFGPSVYDGFFDGFDPQAVELAQVHNPGYAQARTSPPAADMTDLARQILQLADELGWKTFSVVGHSYGGAAGLRIASLAPDRVRSLVGIAPVMPTGFDATAAANCHADANTGPAFLAAYAKGKSAADGPRMIAKVLDPDLSAAELDALMESLYANVSEEVYKQYFMVWTGCAFAADVRNLGTRSLFLLGQSDPFAALNYVTPTVQSMKPGAVTVKTLSGGHFLSVTGRKACAQEIRTFLGA